MSYIAYKNMVREALQDMSKSTHCYCHDSLGFVVASYIGFQAGESLFFALRSTLVQVARNAASGQFGRHSVSSTDL